MMTRRKSSMRVSAESKMMRNWRKLKGKLNFRISPRNRWKSIIRKIIHNLGWISDYPKNEKSNYLHGKKDESDVVSRNEKFLMFKEPLERREDELYVLATKLSAFKSFRKYSMVLRVSLLRRARYIAFKDSVEMVRQGMCLNNLYILVKGTGLAIREYELYGHQERFVTNMREGYMCGEYSLIYGKPSMTTDITQGPTEWIMINKHHFLLYAKDELKNIYYDIECALRKFSFFDNITYFELKEFCVTAEIMKVEANTPLTLFEGTVGLTYFILEGSCSVLQKVVLIKDPNVAYPGYKIHPDQDTNDPAAEKFIIQTCYLTRRGIFGIGEEACKWVIVTDTDCVFMVIPRFMLLKFGRSMAWERLKDQLNNAYPSLKFVLKQFNYLRRWDRYKFNAIRMYTRGLSNSNIHDVPLLARCNELIPEDEEEYYGTVRLTMDKESTAICSIKTSLRTLTQSPILKKLAAYLPSDETIVYQ